MRSKIETRAKDLFELNKQNGKTAKNYEIKKISMSLCKTVTQVQSKSIDKFKSLTESYDIKNNTNSFEEMLEEFMRIESCLFIVYDELEEKYQKDELCIGLIIECDWYLTANQLIFIRNNFRKDQFELNSLDEVIFMSILAFLCIVILV